jgi:hypothetical protein
MNASTQPSEGAGGSRSRAAGELTLGLLSGEEQRVYAAFFVGAGLPAMTACQPTNPSQIHANQTVGAGLLAMAACKPTNLSQMYSISVGARLACDGGLSGAAGLAGVAPSLASQLLHGGVYSLTIRPAALAFDLAFDLLALERPNERGKSPWLLGAGRRSVFPGDPP